MKWSFEITVIVVIDSDRQDRQMQYPYRPQKDHCFDECFIFLSFWSHLRCKKATQSFDILQAILYSQEKKHSRQI